jgi:hypothetical protein
MLLLKLLQKSAIFKKIVISGSSRSLLQSPLFPFFHKCTDGIQDNWKLHNCNVWEESNIHVNTCIKQIMKKISPLQKINNVCKNLWISLSSIYIKLLIKHHYYKKSLERKENTVQSQVSTLSSPSHPCRWHKCQPWSSALPEEQESYIHISNRRNPRFVWRQRYHWVDDT